MQKQTFTCNFTSFPFIFPSKIFDGICPWIIYTLRHKTHHMLFYTLRLHLVCILLAMKMPDMVSPHYIMMTWGKIRFYQMCRKSPSFFSWFSSCSWIKLCKMSSYSSMVSYSCFISVDKEMSYVSTSSLFPTINVTSKWKLFNICSWSTCFIGFKWKSQTT